MEKHYLLTDEELEQQMESCKLDPAVFSHEAHLRLAWIHIQKYGVDKAIKNIQAQLLQFVEQVGARDKYNTTLTIAAIRAVYHFMGRSDATDFYSFLQEFPRLKTNFSGIIESHYQQDIFNSSLAKQQFLEPDLLPFT